MKASEFNEKYPIGTAVIYRSIMDEPEGVTTRTRSEAWELGHGEPVVMVEGKAGGVALRALTIISPIDMLLFCPNCGEQHVDEAKPDVCESCGHTKNLHIEEDPCGAFPYAQSCIGDDVECECRNFTAWLNPPHKSHRCNFCNHVFRPADVPTNGAATLQTKGQRDGDPRPRRLATAKDEDALT